VSTLDRLLEFFDERLRASEAKAAPRFEALEARMAALERRDRAEYQQPKAPPHPVVQAFVAWALGTTIEPDARVVLALTEMLGDGIEPDGLTEKGVAARLHVNPKRVQRWCGGDFAGARARAIEYHRNAETTTLREVYRR